jgi:acetyl-CoA acyltransferase
VARLREAVIVDAVRTPTGKGRPTGALASWHPVDLFAQTLRALVQRNGIESRQVDDVIGGVVTQVGEQGGNLTRQAVLAAGFDECVPATTIDRKCGSSQQAAHFAAQGVMAGAYDLVIAGGVEMLSRVRMQSNTAGADHLGPGVRGRYPGGLVSQGIAAELVAQRWSLSREELDRLSLESHLRAAAATSGGRFEREILPLPSPDGTVVRADEGIRPATTMEALGSLKPAFDSEEARSRHPNLPWVVTAGNASQISDGASAVLIASADTASKLGLTPRAQFVQFAVTGDDPILMLTGVIPATEQILKRSRLTIDDIDLFEVNEAFASVVLAWQRDLGVDGARVNVNGGAIALGHPLGCSGTRLMTTLVHELEHRRARYGLQVMCEAGGQANATIIERL